MADLAAAQIFKITPTPSFISSTGAIQEMQDDGCRAGYSRGVSAFLPTLPFPLQVGRTGPGAPVSGGLNNAYNCVNDNWFNFVGWNNIYMAIDAMLASAQGHGITVSELDIQNEVNFLSFTVEARLIYDNGPDDSATGPVDVLNQLRIRMSNHGFDGGRVFPSTTDFRATAAGADCISVYGDYARVIQVDEVLGAIAGGLFGSPANISVPNGLACGGDTGAGGPNPMIALSSAWPVPDILDMHAYPCVALSSGGPCSSTESQADMQNEARITFSDFQSLINTWSPTGWRGYNPTLFFYSS